jgi:hypothetical protein
MWRALSEREPISVSNDAILYSMSKNESTSKVPFADTTWIISDTGESRCGQCCFSVWSCL